MRLAAIMKAAVQERYGRPDVLRIEDVPVPAGKGQVLVKVAATSINLSDWEGLPGSPGYARLGWPAQTAPPDPRLRHRRVGRGRRRGRHPVPPR